MSQVRVTDVTMKFDAGMVGYQIVVSMVPGQFAGGPTEVDPELVHSAVREHLADWASDDLVLGDLLNELRDLRAQVVLGGPDPAEIAATLGNLVERYTR